MDVMCSNRYSGHIVREEAVMVLIRCVNCDDYLGEDADPMLPFDIENHMRIVHPTLPQVPARADAPVVVNK